MNGFEFVQFAQPVGVVFLVVLCWKLVNNTNAKFKSYVHKEFCHLAMKNLEYKIKDVKEDTQEIKKDVKEILKK